MLDIQAMMDEAWDLLDADVELAAAMARRILAQDPGVIDAYVVLARTCAVPAEGMALLGEAVRIGDVAAAASRTAPPEQDIDYDLPAHVRALNGLARLLWADARPESRPMALRYARRALRLEPYDRAGTRMQLMAWEAAMGNWAAARRLTRAAARIGEQRRQSDNFGFAAGAAAAGSSTRQAAQLDAFIQTLSRTAGNQVDMAEGRGAGIADRARNERLTRIVDNERLTRMQGLLRGHGIALSKRDLALAQNGDLGLNLNADQAAQLHKAGLINDSQYGAIAQGGHARFSFANNDLLVSTAASFSETARNDTSTRFEAGKQAGPDTIEHFLGGGEEGKAAMSNWLQGGFEMDRNGNWRLKPQVADTLQRDVGAIIAQTGWQRSLTRTAEKNTTTGTNWELGLGGGSSATAGGEETASGGRMSRAATRTSRGRSNIGVGARSSETGSTTSTASGTMDIVNYDVRDAIASAERAAARSPDPVRAFTSELSRQVLGNEGLRNRYLENSASGRATWDYVAPLTSAEQSSILSDGRFTTDRDHGDGDGDPRFRTRKD